MSQDLQNNGRPQPRRNSQVARPCYVLRRPTAILASGRYVTGGLVIALLMLVSCAAYKKAGTGGTIVGYDEAPIGVGRYRVTFQGSYDQSPAQIYQWFLLRSAELAKRDAYPYFKVTEGQASSMDRGGTPFPNYSGTVTLLKEKNADDAFDANEIVARTPRK